MAGASTIFFKIGFEKEESKVLFSGNQISLKDLKEQIIDIKNMRSGVKAEWDIDLTIKDANDKSKGEQARTP
jgi:DWNN domain